MPRGMSERRRWSSPAASRPVRGGGAGPGDRFAPAALLLSFALIAPACGPSTAPGGGPALDSAPSPVSGDWLTLPIDSDPATLNFVTGTDVYTDTVARFVADSLVDEGTNLESVPRLASSWEFSGDGRVLTFHLRRGVTWHDGAPFTSRDVVFTYLKIVDPATRARSDLFRDVLDVAATDDFTVRVTYREPTVLALDAWKVWVVPEHLFRTGDFASSAVHRAPIGTGPFRFVSWTRGREIVLAANDRYFLGRPHLDRMVLKIIPSPSTQFQALLTGETDWAAVPPEEWDARSRSEEFRRRYHLFQFTALFLHYIAWNEKSPFFSDPRVRTAMTLSLDRGGYLQKVRRGAGILAPTCFHPRQFGFDPGLEPLPFDPLRAGRLLNEAGWIRDPRDGIRRRNGRKFRFSLLIFQGSTVHEQIAALLQEGLAGNGIRVETRILDFPALLDRLHRRDYEAAISGWSLTTDPDPTGFFHSDPSMGSSNYVGYADPEMDRLLVEGRRAFDGAQRAEIYRRVQAVLTRDQPYTFLFFPRVGVALDARFHGVAVGGATSPLRPFPALLGWYVPAGLQKRPGSAGRGRTP